MQHRQVLSQLGDVEVANVREKHLLQQLRLKKTLMCHFKTWMHKPWAPKWFETLI